MKEILKNSVVAIIILGALISPLVIIGLMIHFWGQDIAMIITLVATLFGLVVSSYIFAKEVRGR